MRAAVCTGYGRPEEFISIKEVALPRPKRNEVLVKVYATTVSRTDCGILWGRPFVIRFVTGLLRPKSISGTDFAGIVEAVGRDVTSFRVGDRVWGFDDSGLRSHAEYLTLPVNKGIDIIPDNIDFEQAAAAIEGGHYAYDFINKVVIKPGKRVLVNGATGAIGSACLQFLKTYGAVVTAVCHKNQFETVMAMGADELIDFSSHDFTSDTVQYDFVFDTVGKSSFGKCKSILAQNGVYISSELGPRNENPYLAIVTPLWGTRRVKFPFPFSIRTSMAFIKRLLIEGKFKPLLDKSYALENIVDAFNYADSGQKIGNIILSISKSRKSKISTSPN